MEIEEFGYKQELKRSLTLTDLVVYGMIFMIPIAPFGVYGYVNAEAPGWCRWPTSSAWWRCCSPR